LYGLITIGFTIENQLETRLTSYFIA